MARHVITPLYSCSFDLSHDEYQGRYEDLAADGYRLVMVDGFRSDDGLRYAGIWIRDQAAGFTRARHGMTSDEYQSEFDDLRYRGYLLEGVTGLSSSGESEALFAAVWNDGSARGYTAHHNMTTSSYQSTFDEYDQSGYQVILVTGYASGRSSRYAAIWSRHDERPRRARHHLPSSEYPSTFDELKDQGYRIAHVNAHEAGGQTYFAGIWVREDGYEPAGRHDLSASEFEGEAKRLAGEDHLLTCLSGYREDGDNRFAAIWVRQSRSWLVHGRAADSLAPFDSAVETHMKNGTVPGGALAVTCNGELVLARGYSWITDLEVPVEPTSLFRIASVSKALTGAAIVRLVQDGLLSFSAKVVDLIDMPGTIRDSRVDDVRIEHLLHHVGGWAGDLSALVMHSGAEIASDLRMPLPITQEAIIRWMNDQSLAFDPGTVDGYEYSNYGYMLLGRIIETTAGIPYERFIQEQLLTPLGIRRMRLGRSLLRRRLPDEVLYHSSNYDLHENLAVPDGPQNAMLQYGGYRSIENTAAHGGWVASAVDLVRFASSFDDPATCPILSNSSVTRLFAEHPYGNEGQGSSFHYGCGWHVRRTGAYAGQSHGGGFEGTDAHLLRWQDSTTGDLFDSAVLFNRDSGVDLLKLLRDAASAVISWPKKGFWDDYLSPA